MGKDIKCETDFEESETVMAETETDLEEIDTEKVPEVAEMQNAEHNPGRLTESDDLGNWGVKGLPWERFRSIQMNIEVSEKIYACLFKLMRYEKTGLSPEEVERLQEDK